MYKVEILSDTIQHAAVDRRRRLDKERQARIFDPKARIMGIDVQALEEQIRLKNAFKDMEKKRADAFHHQSEETTNLLIHLDNQCEISRRNHLKNLAEYRQQNQKLHERRDYDLYDPRGLKKEVPILNLDDERLKHESNLQRFAGEDSERAKRVAQQQRQMKTWAILGINERETQKKRELLEKKEFEDFQNNIAAKARELQLATDQAKFDAAKKDQAINEKLCYEKQQRDAKFKETENEKNIQEIVGQINGNLLTEIPDANNHRVDLFKGFSNEQKRDILLIQDYQRSEAVDRKEKERQIEQEWAEKQAASIRALIHLENEAAEKKRQYAISVRQENQRQAEEARARKKASSGDHGIFPEFFDQFNIGSR